MKLYRILLGIAVCLTAHACAAAYGNLWYDAAADFGAMKTIVLYPIAHEDEANTTASNDYLYGRLAKKLKDVKLIRLAPDAPTDIDAALLRSFADEAERARTVRAQTAADAYLVPRFRENWVRVDESPEVQTTLELRAWTEVTDSPSGSYTTDERVWLEDHITPARDMPCRIMSVDYTLYDANGSAVFTYETSRRAYHTDESAMFKTLTDEFSDDLKKARAGKYGGKADKNKKDARFIGLEPLLLPDDMRRDAYRAWALDFALRDEARRLKGARLSDENEREAPRYLVRGRLEALETQEEWVEPFASVETNSVSGGSRKWKDAGGKEHTARTTYYTQSAADVFGHYRFQAAARMQLELVDAATDATLLTYRKEDCDDKEIDACRHIMKDFYKQVNQYLKEHAAARG